MSLVSDLILPDLLSRDTYWCSDYSQLEFVTDNETLASILNGSALIQSNEHEQILRTSVSRLERLFSDVFVPRYWVTNPVLWRPRQHNKLADALVNCAMNHKQGSEWVSSAWEHHRTFNINFLQVHSDGGVRQNDAASATGFSVIAYVRDGTDYERLLLYAACKYYPYRMSAFRAEALALYDALFFLVTSMC